MKTLLACATLSLACTVAGCSDPFAVVSKSTNMQVCQQEFESASLNNWVSRLARRQGNGTLSLTYGVDLPFDDTKRIENALAQLPGDNQNIRFDQNGHVHVIITGEPPPYVYNAVASKDGKMVLAKNISVTETLCREVNGAGGRLTDISVQTANYLFDDGKIHLPPVP